MARVGSRGKRMMKWSSSEVDLASLVYDKETLRAGRLDNTI